MDQVSDARGSLDAFFEGIERLDLHIRNPFYNVPKVSSAVPLLSHGSGAMSTGMSQLGALR